MASGDHGTLYVGVTRDLQRRVEQHRAKAVAGFTKRYGVGRLVHAQGFGDVRDAITFEKRLKRWRRDWKARLIEETNPRWEDLYLHMTAAPPATPCSWIPDSHSAASGMTDWRAAVLESWTLKF
ncbi:GIY-YIG nuclease family protein [Phenylobacterium sp. LjRoot219]|uniref:GIY-YIG nuclease family protein n=1 Tax=Phenylobacterium sp. LjRoot219 TaxID=3342283 RepID=UPI003F4F868E